MTMARVTRGLPLACLMLLLLRRAPGAGAQVSRGFKLQQPQDKVSVRAGGTLTLTCTTSGDAPAGPVKWLKGWGSGSETAYDQTGSFPRVTREVDGSDTDFTIHIRDVQPEDVGTYYCVKFRKSPSGYEVVQRGKGTDVSVYSTDAQVNQGFKLQQPQDKVSVAVGETLTLTCTTSRDYSGGPMKWLKGWGSGNETIYDQMGSFPRVTRAADLSDTDFTIHIRDVQPEDAGTYYCVKFSRYLGRIEVFRHGKGTEVSVYSEGAQVTQSFELQQPQDKVSVTAGETLTLTCTTSGNGPPGPVKWLKGWGSGNQTIYDQTGSFPRGMRAVNGSDTDFTIHIRGVCPEDAGTYYCVKFRRTVGSDEVLQHGKGTEVSVHGWNLLSSPGLWLGILLEKGLLGGFLLFLFKRGRA
ncbi:signal-regulatory protein beta-2-like [Chroicocephalus ridibundus]|uniref:signal-regulatory protein beta-2-like n=1 Tax=Chroicocephalus ridibundus TaxID=1192867 RepID=UPI002FDCDD63